MYPLVLCAHVAMTLLFMMPDLFMHVRCLDALARRFIMLACVPAVMVGRATALRFEL